MSRVKLTANNTCHQPVVGGERIEGLIAAAQQSDEAVKAFLVTQRMTLDTPADVKNGITALHALLRNGAVAKDLRALERLLRMGANPNLKNLRGETPLMRATITRNAEALDLLIKYGADTEMKDSRHRNINALIQAQETLSEKWGPSELNTQLKQKTRICKAVIVSGTIEKSLDRVLTEESPFPRRRQRI